MKLVRKQFVKWLCEKPSRAYVGHPGAAEYCPLATYLGENDALYGVAVYPSEHEFWGNKGKVIRKNPKWVSEFIKRVDALDVNNVTAQRALRILGEDC